MYFKKNFNQKAKIDPKISPLLSFFDERNKEEIDRIAAEMSPDIKEFFDDSILGLLGQMPEEIADTVISMNRAALTHLLFSSMITGYLAKAVENKLDLEKVWSPKAEANDDESGPSSIKFFL